MRIQMLSDAKLLDRKSYTNLQETLHGFYDLSSFYRRKKKVDLSVWNEMVLSKCGYLFLPPHTDCLNVNKEKERCGFKIELCV